MSEEITPSSSASVTPAPGLPETGTTPASPVGATPQPKLSTTHEDAMARIAELEHSYQNKTEEAARHAKKLLAYEAKEKAAQEAALSEVEKSNKRATEAEARTKQLQQQYISARVQMAAQAKGIIDPELAALAIQGTLEYGEDGMPINLDKILDALVKSKPYLIATPAAASAPSVPAPANAPQAPAIPAMNPGRSSINAPATPPPGQPVRLSDLTWKR